MIIAKRKRRVKVTGKDVKGAMNTLVADAAREEEKAGKEPDPRKTSYGSLRLGFQQRPLRMDEVL